MSTKPATRTLMLCMRRPYQTLRLELRFEPALVDALRRLVRLARREGADITVSSGIDATLAVICSAAGGRWRVSAVEIHANQNSFRVSGRLEDGRPFETQQLGIEEAPVLGPELAPRLSRSFAEAARRLCEGLRRSPNQVQQRAQDWVARECDAVVRDFQRRLRNAPFEQKIETLMAMRYTDTQIVRKLARCESR